MFQKLFWALHRAFKVRKFRNKIHKNQPKCWKVEFYNFEIFIFLKYVSHKDDILLLETPPGLLLENKIF